MAETVSKVMNLLPEYQEEFLKDLLANIYQVDEESGTITGIAAQSPLFGDPILDPDTGEQHPVSICQSKSRKPPNTLSRG